MSETIKHRPTDRFKVVDLLVDICPLAPTITIPMQFDLALVAPRSTTFLSQLLQISLLSLIYFGIHLYVSQMYCATVIRIWQTTAANPILQQSVTLTAISGIMVVTVLFSAVLLFRVPTLPVTSGSLLMV
jgi:hypothetical protein